MNAISDLAWTLCGMQTAVNAIPVAGCCWAISQAQVILQRVLTVEDLHSLGSTLSLPLLLLASTQVEPSLRRTSDYRSLVAREMLECLRDEAGVDHHD